MDVTRKDISRINAARLRAEALGDVMGEGTPSNPQYAAYCGHTYVCALSDGSIVYIDDSGTDTDGMLVVVEPSDQIVPRD